MGSDALSRPRRPTPVLSAGFDERSPEKVSIANLAKAVEDLSRRLREAKADLAEVLDLLEQRADGDGDLAVVADTRARHGIARDYDR